MSLRLLPLPIIDVVTSSNDRREVVSTLQLAIGVIEREKDNFLGLVDRR